MGVFSAFTIMGGMLSVSRLASSAERHTRMAPPNAELRQKLQYICDMLEQLRVIAPSQAGPLLPYLIDVARLEASETMMRQRQGKTDT